MKTQEGFTIIEVLVYLGLYALVMSGIVMSAFNMFELTGRTQTRAMLTSEGNLLLAKINWAMNGATAVLASSTPPALNITRHATPTSVVFNLATSTTDMQLNGVILNNNNVKVQNLVFAHTGSGSAPEQLTASFDLTANTPDGKPLTQSFKTTKYLRK